MISIKETMGKRIYLTKHGFTLVEVIASIAILSVIFISISSFILFNVKLEGRNNSHTNKLALIKSSMEILNSKEDEDILNKNTNKKMYFFFNDLQELKNKINRDDKKELNNISFDCAKENNKEKKRYGLALTIEKTTTNSKETYNKDVNIFFVKSQIWDLSYDIDNGIIKEMYISR